MIETNIPDINVEELLEKIRTEVKQGKKKGKKPSGSTASERRGAQSSLLENMGMPGISSIPNPEDFQIKDHYHINDFLKYRDRNFVMTAYSIILGRRPDSGGMNHFLSSLRSGKMTKAEILGRLRYSRQGRVMKTKVKGLFWNFFVQSSFAIPVLGYFSRLIFGIGNLPLILHNMRVFEERASTQLESHCNDLERMRPRIDKTIEALGQLDSVLNDKIDQSEWVVLKDETGASLESKADRDELVVLKDETGASLESKADRDELRDILQQVRDHRLKILDQQRRLKLLLEEVREKLPESLSKKQIREMVEEESHIFDADYVAFEDRFRGTREDIKERQRVYLPYIRKAGVGTEQFPLLDVGCGRGEWLELLEDENFVARGVDRNRVSIQECCNLGTEVVEGDAVEYLRTLSDVSLGAVTGFHIIEHLPFDLLLALLDETVRVLKPGGVAIFETPNPENILVSACKYYYDPTHRNPLPPAMTQFLVESRGLCRVEILRLHPEEPSSRLTDDGSDLVRRFNEYFYGPQDYAVIGYKV